MMKIEEETNFAYNMNRIEWIYEIYVIIIIISYLPMEKK